MPTKDGERKEQIAHVISAPEQLDEFLHWFTHWLWDSQIELSDDMRQLAFHIQGMIYIFDDGDFTEREFIRRLRIAAHEHGVSTPELATGPRF